MNHLEILKEFYASNGPERVGFVLGNKIVEVKNISIEPNNSFMVSIEDIIEYADKADYFFHTHPGQDSNLSNEDIVGIKSWPNLKHCIIGNDGISCYQYNSDLKAVVRVNE